MNTYNMTLVSKDGNVKQMERSENDVTYLVHLWLMFNPEGKVEIKKRPSNVKLPVVNDFSALDAQSEVSRLAQVHPEELVHN